MSPTFRFITHPQVAIDPLLPVPKWGLSELGVTRTRAMLNNPWVASFGRIVCSSENKAIETATILSTHINVPIEVREELGENDRSATGFVPPDQFEQLANRFFANPDSSIEGWESATNAQRRIVIATADLFECTADVAVVAHGGVGTLLYCHLAGLPIARIHDQPGQGHYFSVDCSTQQVLHGWLPIDGNSFVSQ